MVHYTLNTPYRWTEGTKGRNHYSKRDINSVHMGKNISAVLEQKRKNSIGKKRLRKKINSYFRLAERSGATFISKTWKIFSYI